RTPAQLACGALARDGGADQVADAALDVHDRHLGDEPAHDVGYLAHGDALLADQVVDPAGCDRRERGDDAVGEILDVDEATRLPAVAGDLERAPGERTRDECGDDGAPPGALTVRDPEAQDGLPRTERL